MSELGALLTAIDAPEEVIAWASSHEDLDAAWQECARAEHRMWLAALAGAPVELLIESVAAALFEVAGDGEDFAGLVHAVEDVVAEDDGAECLALAKLCEELGQRGSAGYRTTPTRGYVALARAAELVCRAREGLLSAELALEASRLDRARDSSAMLGGGMHAFVQADPGPARLSDVPRVHAARGVLLFVVAACAEALRELSTALRERRGAEAGNVDSDLDVVVWQVLVPDEAD